MLFFLSIRKPAVRRRPKKMAMYSSLLNMIFSLFLCSLYSINLCLFFFHPFPSSSQVFIAISLNSLSEILPFPSKSIFLNSVLILWRLRVRLESHSWRMNSLEWKREGNTIKRKNQRISFIPEKSISPSLSLSASLNFSIILSMNSSIPSLFPDEQTLSTMSSRADMASEGLELERERKMYKKHGDSNDRFVTSRDGGFSGLWN